MGDNAAWSLVGSARKPDFFIVGGPGAGTSALFESLRQHPDIFMPDLKEPQFFGADQHHVGHQRRRMSDYLALFAQAGGAVRVGEASTNYLHSRLAAGEIKAFSPQASIIVMARNPVDMMQSYHSTQVVYGFEPIEDFALALAAEPSRRHGGNLPTGSGVLENLHYRDIADLATHIERFVDVFGWDRVRVILYDDWTARAERVYGETLAFLGVNPLFSPAFDTVNASRRVAYRRLHAFILDPPRPIRTASGLVSARLRSQWRHRMLNLSTRPAARDPLEPGFLRQLHQEFAEDVARLGKLVGRDLSPWTEGRAIETT